jgi:hypothetical protein
MRRLGIPNSSACDFGSGGFHKLTYLRGCSFGHLDDFRGNANRGIILGFAHRVFWLTAASLGSGFLHYYFFALAIHRSSL